MRADRLQVDQILNEVVLTPLQQSMVRLDGRLTGTRDQDIIQQIGNKPQDLEDWWEGHHGIWYLSDGGYSRILLDEDALEGGDPPFILLATVSTDTAKANWKEADEEKQAVDRAIAQELAHFG